MRYLFGVSLMLILMACSGGKKLVENKAPAQPQLISSGTVHYDVAVDKIDPNMSLDIGETATLYFNESIARQEEQGAQTGESFLITDLVANNSTSYVDFMGKKFAISMEGPMIPKIIDIKYLEETKELAGYTCKKATGSMGGQAIEIYYTQQLKPKYCPYQGDLNGFALAYTLAMPFGKITYTANKVLASPPPAEKMIIPEGFKKVTPMELQKELMNQEPSFDLEEIPDFTLSDLDGNEVQLSGLNGKVVVMNFWFIACKPCQMEMPDLNELKAEYKGKEVAFLGITFDKKADVQKFLNTNPFEFQILSDAGPTIQDYGVMAFPTTVVLGKDGQVVDSVVGGSMNIKEIIQGMIEKGLQ